jgi:SRSO17 transposase
MDADEIRQLKPMLSRFLRQFDGCFARPETRAHLPVYVEGQLSDLPRKSVEPMAVQLGVAPRTLQEFLSLLKWDEDRMRDRLAGMVAGEDAGPHAIGVIDETGWPKKGEKTPGVQRQWCGATGKIDNCVVTVHLSLAREGFHCLLDGELYLPESWAQDGERRRQAGIPGGLEYRPKWQIALELYDRAARNGVTFSWLTFDEDYGAKRPFLRALVERGQRFIGEVPRTFAGWIDPPGVTTRPFRRATGRPRRTPRLRSGSRPAWKVEALLRRSPALRDQPWQAWRVKEGTKGPMVWEAKHVRLYVSDEGGLPAEEAWHLVVARNVLRPAELKFFVSNAAPDTPLGSMLLAAFSRWHVERCFEDAKGEVGLDHYEGRLYRGLKRHMAVSAVSYLFLARVHARLAGRYPQLTEVQVHRVLAALVPAWWLGKRVSERLIEQTARIIRTIQASNAKAQVSHAKATGRKLCRLGINPSALPRCSWAGT